MRLTKMFLPVTVAFLLSGCIYSHVTVPYGTDLNKTVLGDKTGKASTHSVLWLFSWGDAGVAAASRNAGIKTLDHMDHEVLNVLFGLYTRSSTIVYGD